MKKSMNFIIVTIAAIGILGVTLLTLIREKAPSPDTVIREKEKFQVKSTPTLTPASTKETGDSTQGTQSHDDARIYRISVKVSDNEKKPIQRALIELFPYQQIILPVPLESISHAQTGADGSGEIKTTLSGTFVLKISAAQRAAVLRKLELKNPSEHKRIAVILSSEKRIQGVVKNEKGEPVSHGMIGPLLPEPEAESVILMLPEFAQTEANGTFAFPGLDTGMYRLQIAIPGYVPMCRDQIEAPCENLEIVVKSGGTTVKGITAGAKDGQPKSNVGVFLIGQGFFLYTLSQKEGNFLFRNIGAGEYYAEPILNDRRMGKPVEFKCDGTTPVEDLILKVQQGILISGIVIEAVHRTPLEGVVLEIKETGEPQTAASDNQGQFQFPSVFPEKGLEILISSPEYYFRDEYGTLKKSFPVEGYMPDSDIADIRIPLEKEYLIKGVAHNIEPEKRNKYKIRIEPLETESKRKVVWEKLKEDNSFTVNYIGSGQNVAGIMDEQGKLASEPVEFTLSPLAPPSQLQLFLAPAAKIKGRALMHTGDPLPQCSILAKGKMSSQETLSNDKGEFSFETHEKFLHVEATSPHYTQKLEREITLPLSEDLVFMFTIVNMLKGSVTSSSQAPVGFARITYQWLNTTTGESIRKTVNADKEGVFRITDVTSDVVDILICEGPAEGKDAGKKFGKVELKNISLPQEELKIVLLQAGTIHLTILDENNSPYSGNFHLVVKVQSGDQKSFEIERRESENAREGRCLIGSLNPGFYIISIKTMDGHSGDTDPIDINESNPDAEATIRLHQAASIYGYVYDKNTNNPILGVNVIFDLTEAQNIQQGTSTNQEGFYEMKDLVDGRIFLRFGKQGYNNYSQAVNLSQGSGDVNLPLNVYLESALSSVEGVVVNSQGQIVFSVLLTIRKLDEEYEMLSNSQTMRSSEEGTFSFDQLSQGEYLLLAEKEKSSGALRFTLQAEEKKQVKVILQNNILVRGTLKTEQTRLYEQPLLFGNIETHKNYMAPLDKDHKFEIYLPVGEYQVHIGDSEISGDLSLSGDTEAYDLDLSF